MNEIKRVEIEQSNTRHREISEKIIKMDNNELEKLCGLKKKVKFNTFTDDFACDCGNQRNIDGFHPCDKKGNLMDPDKDSIWDHDYWCGRCGVIIHVLVSEEKG